MTANLPLVSLVDDDATVRKALSRLIRSLAFECEDFASAEQFIREGTSSNPVCVFADYHMPETTGLDLVICLGERDLHIPIIIMTGFDEDGLQEKCLGAGAIDYLLKPLDGPTIASAIHRAQMAKPLKPGW